MKYFLLSFGLLLLGGIGPQWARAQAPAWQSVRTVAGFLKAASSNSSTLSATAVDAAGNVFLAGNFTNTVVLGSTTLTSLGGADVFVAKFSPASNRFVWAQRAGGVGEDYAQALAVSGPSVYVAGYFNSATANFGPTVLTSAGDYDVFVAKLADAGSTGSFGWAQRAGGSGLDRAVALAASGPSVYVVGDFKSPTADFGTTTLATAGAEDGFIAKLTDAGGQGSFGWAQRAGGTGDDRSTAVAVSGPSVYVTGNFDSSAAGFGATTLASAGDSDVFVAKLVDAGSTGRFGWVQRAGGTAADEASALVVSGPSLYVAGTFRSAPANFGPEALTSAGPCDAFVGKLTDAGGQGRFAWTRRAGTPGRDYGTALAVSGTSVYLAGGIAGAGIINQTNPADYNVFVAKFTDAGGTADFGWAQGAGGPESDSATALAVSGTSLYVAGTFSSPTADFGTLTLPSPNPGHPFPFLAALPDPALVAIPAAGSR